MKVPPLNLGPDVNRVGLSLPFSPELLWRYPTLSLQQSPLAHPPSSPLNDVKNQMPAQLSADPRMWSREDVSAFIRWFEREFELPKIDSSKFCMNGKALCMLTKTDLADRAPGAGDVLHNTLQFLLRDTPNVPPSPLTPHHPLLSPSPMATSTSQPWSLVGSEFHNLGHLLQQGGSVTLSPAPSEQSGGSPRHSDAPSTTLSGNGQSGSGNSESGSAHSASASSNSDSEDSTRDISPRRTPPNHPAFSAQALASLKHLTDYQRAAAAAAAAAAVAAHSQHEDQFHHHQQQQQQQQKKTSPSSNLAFFQAQQQQQQQQQTQQQQHFSIQTSSSSGPSFGTPSNATGDEPVETGSNGRLLWDFLQQLLNDSQQRYSRYIAWKNCDTGVFKIVDPPGLARLWGIQKNHLSMNYDKMSRALRYYYRVNILRKVQGERHCYQFLRNPSELKNIKNISLLRGTPAPPASIKWEVSPPAPMEEEEEEDEGPTDLSMPPSASSPAVSQMVVEPQNLSVPPLHSEVVKSESFLE